MCERVILWSSPRSGSTVFERSIRELEGVRVLHEPHQHAYCFGPDKVYPHTLYYEDGRARVEPTATYEAARKKIISLAEECGNGDYQYLFIKDLAYYITGKHGEYVQGSFARFKHTFLIRHPLTVMKSWHKLLADSHWSYEIGRAHV